jgi:hypothetical protein
MTKRNRWLNWHAKTVINPDSARTEPSESSAVPTQRNRWLGWQPKARINANTAEMEPSKPSEQAAVQPLDGIKPKSAQMPPTKPSEPALDRGSDGFDGPQLGDSGFIAVSDEQRPGVDLGSAPPAAGTGPLCSEIELWKNIFGATEAMPCPDPVPSGLRIVNVTFGTEVGPMMLVKHNHVTPNRFGQDPQENPLAVINHRSWEECPFDLRRVRWFKAADQFDGITQGGEV